MTRFSFLAAILLSVSAAAQQKINFENAPASPEIFAAGAVSSGLSERDFALSPDGTELLYTVQLPQGLFQTLVYRKKDSKGNWSKPAIASFAGKFSDLEPAFSADGKKLFFSSNRPVSGTAIKDFDIWVVEKVNGSWGEPKNLGAPVNTEADEFYPSVAKNGNLYFTAAYKNGPGKEDIYMATWNNGSFREAVALDTTVNSKTYEFNAFISPDEDFVIFTSYGRKDDKGSGDLYISLKDPSGHWKPAVNLEFLNSKKIEYCPFVSPDRKILFFTSERIDIPQTYIDKPLSMEGLQKIMSSPKNGNGDIYWISFETILKKVRG